MRTYHPGIRHDHLPCGRWHDVQSEERSSVSPYYLLGASCSLLAPRQLADLLSRTILRDKPLALDHLNWYLHGHGRDYVEDRNIHDLLMRDFGIQLAINSRLPSARSSGTHTFRFKVEQEDYDSDDFCFAFGAIDIFEVEVDYGAGTVSAWFQDRYEWHPVYRQLYALLPGDERRPTNIIHAAMVELKRSGAADFWMKGEATIPLNIISAATQSPLESQLRAAARLIRRNEQFGG